MMITALIPAHNEAESIAATIEGVLAQTRVPDRIVVVANGCTDNTADIARRYPVTVLDLPRLEHRKSEALNIAWAEFGRDADVVICLDADTVLAPNSVEDWEAEMAADPLLGGSSSKFTMVQPGILARLQKAEFATWTQTALDRGQTNVLAGTGCAISGEALRRLASRSDRVGPWCYTSATEDFELTYRIREMGYYCQVSPTVRAYTDSMRTIRSLWAQRMKWQVGTVDDLLDFGLNRLTWRDWAQQGLGALNIIARSLWVAVIASVVLMDMFTFIWFWWCLPIVFITLDLRRTMRVPHRGWRDVALALSFFPTEAFQWLRGAWFLASWVHVARSRITKRHTDLWGAQYKAEGA